MKKLKVLRTEYHTTWYIGEYQITWERRHGQFDVSRDNLHYLCVCYLASAVEWILRDQGWFADAPKDVIESAALVLASQLEKAADKTPLSDK